MLWLILLLITICFFLFAQGCPSLPSLLSPRRTRFYCEGWAHACPFRFDTLVQEQIWGLVETKIIVWIISVQFTVTRQINSAPSSGIETKLLLRIFTANLFLQIFWPIELCVGLLLALGTKMHVSNEELALVVFELYCIKKFKWYIVFVSCTYSNMTRKLNTLITVAYLLVTN